MSMTRNELFEFQQKTFHNIMEVTKKKNADYSGKGTDAFKNFNLVEAFGCVTTEQGFFTRMTDKFARISSFIENGELQVKDESVTDTLMDLANYSVLFMAYLEGKKKEKLIITKIKATDTFKADFPESSMEIQS